jgi:hypothetical protein
MIKINLEEYFSKLAGKKILSIEPSSRAKEYPENIDKEIIKFSVIDFACGKTIRCISAEPGNEDEDGIYDCIYIQVQSDDPNGIGFLIPQDYTVTVE